MFHHPSWYQISPSPSPGNQNVEPFPNHACTRDVNIAPGATVTHQISHEDADTQNSAAGHSSSVNIENTNSARNLCPTLHETPNHTDGDEEGLHRGLDEVEGIQQ